MERVNERGRRHLYQQAEASMDAEAADTLMAHLPDGGAAEVATKKDVADTRRSLESCIELTRAEFRAAISDVQSTLTTTYWRTTIVLLLGLAAIPEILRELFSHF